MKKSKFIAGILGCFSSNLFAVEKLEYEDVNRYVSASPLILNDFTITGKKLSLLFRASFLDTKKGIKPPKLEWKASNKDPELLALLNDAIKNLGRPSGYYTFNLVVHDVDEQYHFFVKKRFFVIEGRIVDPEANKEIPCANVAGCFMTKETAEKEDGKFTFKYAVDRLIDGIKTEQLKPGDTSRESMKQKEPRAGFGL